MSERDVIVLIGESNFSIPFKYVDEIVSYEKVLSRDNLPEGMLSEDRTEPYWVAARDEWLPLILLMPGAKVTEHSQVVIINQGPKSIALSVDQVVGMEDLDTLIPLPGLVSACTRFPISGVHLWREKVVLELDLSRFI
ncbi:MAG: chemotaxis protein CheW [bacterium]